MYTQWIYNAFVQLRKQLYKIKKRDNLSRYSEIELHQMEYKTFRRFSDSVSEWNEYFEDFNSKKTTQEVFDNLLDLSQKNILKYYH